MNKISTYFLSFILFVCLAGAVSPSLKSQTIADLMYSGDALYLEGNYYSASQYYYKAFLIDSTRLRTVSKYADCCRLFYNYEEAARMYRYLIQKDDKSKFPEAVFWLGMMYKSLGNYQEASLAFQRYTREHKDTKDPLFIRSQLEANACTWASEAVSKEAPVQLIHFGAPINSEYSDFGALQMGDSLLYFSALLLDNDLPIQGVAQGSYLTKIYESRINAGMFSNPAELSGKINQADLHNANLCFASNHQQYFFTRCADERRPDLQCELFMVYRKGGKWQKPVRLDNSINFPGSTITQPAMAHGEKEDILYFVSDRPGGFGGKDIWYAVVKRGKIGKPSNLGSLINTPGDEITPYYNNKTGELFFSSDYHAGFGGYDIFRSKGSYNHWAKPQNIGAPLNTSFNELYFTVNEVDSNGYLTSNRPGSFFIKNQTCCNDIWIYKYEQKVDLPLPFTTVAEDKKSDSVPTDTLKSNENIIRQFLPLSLYFHNDEPDPATMKESTTSNYSTALAEYVRMKDLYKTEYSKGLSGDEKIQAENDIEDFFTDVVVAGMRQLEEFTSLLYEDLSKGNSVMVTIKGFTSPLNTAEYNKALAKRRISSLINYFLEYKKGVLLPYINGTAPNQSTLVFLEEPIGEEMSDQLVSDNPNDQRNSVYSRAAALERRIQILYYDGQ
jgi:outer membrane protein OmpA-like peptidoglycan-associated protein